LEEVKDEYSTKKTGDDFGTVGKVGERITAGKAKRTGAGERTAAGTAGGTGIGKLNKRTGADDNCFTAKFAATRKEERESYLHPKIEYRLSSKPTEYMG
jgi:hypothetical protein